MQLGSMAWLQEDMDMDTDTDMATNMLPARLSKSNSDTKTSVGLVFGIQFGYQLCPGRLYGIILMFLKSNWTDVATFLWFLVD